MNEQVDNAEYEFLWKLLANPADPNHSYIFSLQSLVTDFPQSGVLRALLMPNGDKRHLKRAAAYFDPRILHKLATATDSLAVVTAEQIVHSDTPEPVAADAYFNIPVAEPFVPPAIDTDVTHVATNEDTPFNTFAEQETGAGAYPSGEMETAYNTFAEREKEIMEQFSNDETEQADEQTDIPVADAYLEETPAYVADEGAPPDNYQIEKTLEGAIADAYLEEIPAYLEDDNEPYHYPPEDTTLVHNYAFTQNQQDNIEATAEEKSLLAKEYDEFLLKSDAQPIEPVYAYDENVNYFHQDIDDEVYDEIVSIEDISLEQLAILNKTATNDAAEPAANTSASDNYFVFEPVSAEDNTPGADNLHPAIIAAEGPDTQYQAAWGQPKSNVSRYNDEKMPYTFMWWLDKTRKEHAETYQPYINNIPPATTKPANKTMVDELQQQYYQNIVSISSINNLGPVQPAEVTPPVKKEDIIIERFIQEEPQIKHPRGAKLDNENKARHSSEDKDELVTETLARIYTEQMLYNKAILTYKKLMLKFPEKSLYFAGQIEQLENKIN